MIEATPELEDAIRNRDALIERIRAGEEGLIEEMIEACERVEKIGGGGVTFDWEYLRPQIEAERACAGTRS